jgi:hypothetical protein
MRRTSWVAQSKLIVFTVVSIINMLSHVDRGAIG